MALTQKEKDELELLELEQEQFEFEKMKSQMRMKEHKRSVVAEEAEVTQAEMLETASDVGVGMAQGATYGFADEIYGLGMSTFSGTPYEAERDVMRSRTKLARERTPTGTFLGEMAGGMATSGGTGGLAKTVGQAALLGVGESEAEDVGGMAADAAITASIGALSHGAVGLAKAPFKKPDVTRAKTLGANIFDFKKRGVHGDPRMMAHELNQANIFKYPSARLDPVTLKFKKRYESQDIIPSRESILSNVKSGLKTISNEKNKILRSIKGGAKEGRLMERFAYDLQSLKEKSTDPDNFSKIAKEEVAKIVDTIKKDNSITRLEKVKQNWQNQAKKTFESSASDPVFKDRSEIQAQLSSSLKDELEDAITESVGVKTGNRFMDLNSLGSNLHQAKSGLIEVVAGGELAGAGELGRAMNPYASVMLQAAKVGEFIGGGEKGQLLRATVGETAEKYIPEAVESAATMATPRVFSGRSPDSVSVAEEVTRWKIPRSTQGVVENSDKILAKIAQMEPMQFDNIKEIIENEPDKIPEVLPLIAQSLPHLFDSDKYGRFDGIIYDPAKKQLAREDINLNETLTNSQKMLMMNQLNKTGEFDL